jgi:hypothetical protein
LVKPFSTINPISNFDFTAIPRLMDLKGHHAASILAGVPDSAAVCVEGEDGSDSVQHSH